MEQYQLHIFASLVVVLGAACVALICDFLKRNNEQLRELTIELTARREEDQRRSQLMAARAMAAPAFDHSPATPAVDHTTAAPAIEQDTHEERIAREPGKSIDFPAAEAVAAPVPSPAAKVAPPPSMALSRDVNRKRPASPDAVAAFERGELLASLPGKRMAVPTAAGAGYSQEQDRLPSIKVLGMTAASLGSITAAVPEKHCVEAALAALRVSASETRARRTQSAGSTKSILSNEAAQSRLVRKPYDALPRSVAFAEDSLIAFKEDLLDEVVAAAAPGNAESGADEFPSGFHDGFVLSRLVESRRPVSGLVVSIGVNTSRNTDGSLPDAVRQLIQTLIGPEDFACQSNREEFLLIFPHERGASAQRRLSGIAQRLWDFQLRSLSTTAPGTFAILFSWGGVEVRSESIDEAIASANERMQDTRRGRKLLTMQPRGEAALRHAV